MFCCENNKSSIVTGMITISGAVLYCMHHRLVNFVDSVGKTKPLSSDLVDEYADASFH